MPSRSGTLPDREPEVRSPGSVPAYVPVKTCVGNDGVKEPARRSSSSISSRSSSIVTPGTTRGATASIVRVTVPHARVIASSSSAVFTRRSSLTSAEPVRSASRPTTRARWIVVSAQTRSPSATHPAGPRPRTTCSNTECPSSVSSTTTTSPSGSEWRSKTATIRGSTKVGSASSRKKAPVTQPWT